MENERKVNELPDHIFQELWDLTDKMLEVLEPYILGKDANLVCSAMTIVLSKMILHGFKNSQKAVFDISKCLIDNVKSQTEAKSLQSEEE